MKLLAVWIAANFTVGVLIYAFAVAPVQWATQFVPARHVWADVSDHIDRCLAIEACKRRLLTGDWK